MGKINKFANLYDRNGDLLKSVNDQGILTSYTTEELEQLLDKLGNEKDENGRIKNPDAYNNVARMLLTYYQIYGNPHEEEIKAKLAEKAKEISTDEQAIKKLEEMRGDLSVDEIKNALDAINIFNAEPKETIMDEYVDFEEVKDDERGDNKPDTAGVDGAES